MGTKRCGVGDAQPSMPARESQEETLNLAGGHSASDCWNDSVKDEVLQGRKMVRSDLKHTDGPAAPPVCRAARRMAVLSRLVNSTGWGCAGGCPWRSDAGEAGSAGGCLLRSTCRTVSSPMTSSRSSTPPL